MIVKCDSLRWLICNSCCVLCIGDYVPTRVLALGSFHCVFVMLS